MRFEQRRRERAGLESLVRYHGLLGVRSVEDRCTFAQARERWRVRTLGAVGFEVWPQIVCHDMQHGVQSHCAAEAAVMPQRLQGCPIGYGEP